MSRDINRNLRQYRVALAGYYGFGNLGDELLAAAALDALSRCGVDRSRVVLLSNDPKESENKYAVDAVNRWNIRAVGGVLLRSDTLLLGGGGLFQDATSLRSCLYYWGLVRLARACGAVPWALGQSVGPLSTRAGRFLTRVALRSCRIVQVRDEPSRALCGELGISAELGKDLVFSLAGTAGELLPTDKKPTLVPRGKILVNLRPCAQDRLQRLPLLREALAGREVRGIALSEEDEELLSRLHDAGELPCAEIVRVRGTNDVARAWEGAVGAYGMRLHFCVLSALTGTPLVALPYDPKVAAFAREYGVPAWLGGPLPAPRTPVFPAGFSPTAVQGEIDALCRRVLADS